MERQERVLRVFNTAVARGAEDMNERAHTRKPCQKDEATGWGLLQNQLP